MKNEAVMQKKMSLLDEYISTRTSCSSFDYEKQNPGINDRIDDNNNNNKSIGIENG
jgi:hypothetical protein